MDLGEYHRIIRVEDETSLTNHDGLLKLWYEQTTQWYASGFSLSIIAVRIGVVPRKLPAADLGLPALHSSKKVNRLVYLSRNGAGRFFTTTAEARNIDFAVLVATSGSLERVIFDLEPAKRVIGYEPEGTYPVIC